MSRLCILLFLFLLMINPAISQEYHYVPFPDSNAVWSEVYWKPIYEPDPRWVFNQYALFNEDTIINGTTYHKLFHTNASEITRENSEYIGALREDRNKRILIKYDDKFKPDEPYYKKEFLLYNFGLNVGDTIWNEKDSIEITPFEYLVIKAIDTIQVYNTRRKVFSFLEPSWVYWIEGIGNVKGLIFTSGDLPFNGMDNDLVCMHQNDTLLYYYSGSGDVYYDDCVPSFVIDGAALLPNPDVKVYPNPVKGGTVYFENLDYETLGLFDLHGKLVLEEKIKNTRNFELNISCLSPGIYTYKLQTKGLIPTQGKLVIQ